VIDSINAYPIFWLFVAGMGIYAFCTAMRKVDLYYFKARKFAAMIVLFAAGIIFLPQLGYQGLTVVLGSLLIAVVGSMIVVPEPKSSRYISKRLKRAIIERDLPKSEKYDSRKYHFDHQVPYSRGGDTSSRNLKLRPKRDNLRKGAKRPRLRDFFD